MHRTYLTSQMPPTCSGVGPTCECSGQVPPYADHHSCIPGTELDIQHLPQHPQCNGRRIPSGPICHRRNYAQQSTMGCTIPTSKLFYKVQVSWVLTWIVFTFTLCSIFYFKSTQICFIKKGTLQRTTKYLFSYTLSRLIY